MSRFFNPKCFLGNVHNLDELMNTEKNALAHDLILRIRLSSKPSGILNLFIDIYSVFYFEAYASCFVELEGVFDNEKFSNKLVNAVRSTIIHTVLCESTTMCRSYQRSESSQKFIVSSKKGFTSSRQNNVVP